MYKFFRPNSLIDETEAVCRRRTFFKVAITFLLVYMIGSMLASMVMTAPMMTYIMTDPEITDLMTSDLSVQEYNDKLTEALTRIYANLPDWMNAISLYTTVATIAVVIFYCTRLEKRRLYTLGFRLKGAVLEYLSGIVIGAVLFSAVYGIDLLSGEITFSGFNKDVSIGTLLLFFFGFIIQGASEEILLRGYFFVSTASCGNVPVALFVSSGLFAMMHAGNTGVSILAVFNIFLFGVFAALYFLRRGSIWGICAIHSIWNFAQGNIFGCRVSGMEFGSSLFGTSANGGIWSGGAFGPEGGLGTTVVLSIAILIVTFMKNKTHEGFYIRKVSEARSNFY